jgi:plastocyanin
MRTRVFISLVVVAVAVAALFGFSLTARGANAEPREIVLVARGMSFYLAGDETANPTIHLRQGETVRIVLRNDTPGMTHDFAASTLGLEIAPLDGGSTGSVFVRVPSAPGLHEYICRPHVVMMKGQISIE